MPVMNWRGEGAASADVVNALTWLAETHEVHVDIVLMAFGRQADPGDDDLGNLRKAVDGLSQMPIVASAGNDDSDRTVYPAALAAEKRPVGGERRGIYHAHRARALQQLRPLGPGMAQGHEPGQHHAADDDRGPSARAG